MNSTSIRRFAFIIDKHRKCFFGFTIVLLTLFSAVIEAIALGPEEIVVVANRSMPGSVKLARDYMQSRQIPPSNLLKLWVTDQERCSREAYDRKIARPTQQFLKKLPHEGKKIRCLLLIYGVPLRVGPPEIQQTERLQIKQFNQEILALKAQKAASSGAKSDSVRPEIERLNRLIRSIRAKDRTASVDSELALVRRHGDYELAGWVLNPYFVGFKDPSASIQREDVLMVSRLDGPSLDVVRKRLEETLATEKTGLEGRAYFDARWPDTQKKKTKGYGLYDQSIHRAAQRVEKSDLLAVTVDDKQTLFPPGSAPQTALYCGWYSLAKYVDAFSWVPGAVGYHIASSECTTLRRQSSRVWCKMMLEKGAAATIGPVTEPYVQAFPLPEVFFGLLVDGHLTLAECYLASLPFLSWQMVLVGDPLYQPFRHRAGLD